ncbi:hypothetical protein [Borrelia sp. RT1S]|uniref:hypothetical protein n=1 Tax=Borrelia sp. RT1S TaxID=2898580 RepID=UPI001E5304E7|nr:hypothetical protein [Borrelia sp. RT1S]UGQ17043.1 hypothetical protein LSO05_01200 [Borrelia sp. RT1S]
MNIETIVTDFSEAMLLLDDAVVILTESVVDRLTGTAAFNASNRCKVKAIEELVRNLSLSGAACIALSEALRVFRWQDLEHDQRSTAEDMLRGKNFKHQVFTRHLYRETGPKNELYGLQRANTEMDPIGGLGKGFAKMNADEIPKRALPNTKLIPLDWNDLVDNHTNSSILISSIKNHRKLILK